MDVDMQAIALLPTNAQCAMMIPRTSLKMSWRTAAISAERALIRSAARCAASATLSAASCATYSRRAVRFICSSSGSSNSRSNSSSSSSSKSGTNQQHGALAGSRVWVGQIYSRRLQQNSSSMYNCGKGRGASRDITKKTHAVTVTPPLQLPCTPGCSLSMVGMCQPWQQLQLQLPCMWASHM